MTLRNSAMVDVEFANWPRLFHGHHPACPYTIEGDWSVCTCSAQRFDNPPDADEETVVEAVVVKDGHQTYHKVTLPAGTRIVF